MAQAREIFSGEVNNEDGRRTLLNQLDAIEQFLKFTYLEHIEIDTDVLHSKTYALGESTIEFDRGPAPSSCKVCLTPFQILRNIEAGLEERRDDILSSLKEISHKMLLYMGHQHRCYNQEQRIAGIFDDLNKDEGVSKAVILVDYKMKFEAIRFHEKTTEFFGKKGMSWHGAVIFHKAEGSPSTDRNGSDDDKMELSNLFFDHLISNDMTQDCVAVCSILDAILARLRVELRSVKQFYLLSDNARCYQNDLLPVMSPIIAQKHSLSMDGFIHSETQRGKSLVDAHFALAMMHINRYCNATRRDITTPADVVEALNSFGDVANCTAEILYIRSDYENMVKWSASHKGGKIGKMRRINEFVYTKCGADFFTVKCYPLSGGTFSEFQLCPLESQLIRQSAVNCIPANSAAEIIEDGDEGDEDTPNSASGSQGSRIEGEDNVASTEEIAYQSTITGVTVWGRSRLRKN